MALKILNSYFVNLRRINSAVYSIRRLLLPIFRATHTFSSVITKYYLFYLPKAIS